MKRKIIKTRIFVAQDNSTIYYTLPKSKTYIIPSNKSIKTNITQKVRNVGLCFRNDTPIYRHQKEKEDNK